MVSLLGNRIRNITTGRQHILALASNGSLYSWGDNTFCQLGLDPHHLWKAGQSQARNVKEEGYSQEDEDDVFVKNIESKNISTQLIRFVSVPYIVVIKP